jgi:hypothetical protein
VFTGLCLVLPASAAWQRNGPSMPTRSRPSPINFLQLQSSSECSHQFAIVPCPSHRPSSTTSPSFTTFHVPSSEALLEIRQKAGSVGCLGPSIATTPPSKLLCAPRCSRWFMALTPPPPPVLLAYEPRQSMVAARTRQIIAGNQGQAAACSRVEEHLQPATS